MKKRSRFLRVLGVAGLLAGLLAATIAPAAAQDDDGDDDVGRSLAPLFTITDPGFLGGNNTIFYPWVANDDDFGLGAADTSISVQNLESVASQIFIYVGNAGGGYDLATTAFLSPWAAKTFTAAQLGIAEGEGAPVAVASWTAFVGVSPTNLPVGVPVDALTGVPAGATLVETPVILSNPITVDDDGGESTQVIVCVVNYHTAAQPGLGQPWGYVDAQTGDWESFTTQAELQATLNAANAGDPDELINPFAGLNNDGDCYDVLQTGGVSTFLDSVAIGGVAKQAVEGESLPATSMVDTAVSGYNAINGAELAAFDEWYLPIVQTNCGPGGCWDSVIRVGTLFGENASVEIRFFPADDGSGSLNTGFQLQALVNGGDTWHVNLSDYVPEGWVGSAHIYSDGAAFAMVDRYKVGYNMWLTNTGSSADFENEEQIEGSLGSYVLFAPHVLLDYYGWNTGINVANLADSENNVSIQYFNLLGNATETLNQRISAHGMTYFYDPSIAAQDNNSQDVASDPNAGVVGSALIWSDSPVAAVVDATKYPETDLNGGADLFQATSYSATANIFTWQAVPLAQKGNPVDGSGDTSGINIMNPNATAVTANVYWVNPSGFTASNFGVSSVTIPGFANGFIYTLWQHNLPNGFLGAAQVVASQPVAAVSATVNYQVDGDGSAIFNAFNPCGFYRTAGDCSFGDPFEPGGQSVTKTFVDQFGEPVAGVGIAIAGTTADFPYQRDGVSGIDGSQTFTNVPVGEYELFVTSVPSGYLPVDPNEAQESFTVSEGEDVTLENVLTREIEVDPGSLVVYVCDELNTSVEGCDVEQNEIQELAIITNGSFGFQDCTFQLEFAGETTDDLSCFTPSTIEEIQSALEVLSTVGTGNVIVTGGPIHEAPIQIEFVNELAVTDMTNEVTLINIQNAVGGENTTIQDGRVSTAFPDATVQVFVALEDSDLADDTTWGDEVTDGPQATDAEGRFELSDLEPGAYIVCASATAALPEDCQLVEVSEDTGTLLVINLDQAGTVAASETSAQNEIQTLTQAGFTNDTFTLTLAGQTTPPIGGRQSGLVVQSELEALSNVGFGNVTCTGSFQFGGDIVCEFINDLAGQDVAEITASNSGLSMVTVATTQDGGTSATISADELVSGGTFTITFDGATTVAIDWDATATEIEDALNALSTIGGAGGSVTVSGGPLPGEDVLVLFGGSLAGTALNLTIDNSDLT